VADNSFQDGTDPIATDEITGGVADGVKVARSKTGFGADGEYVDVDAEHPLPVVPLVATDIGAAELFVGVGEEGTWLQLADTSGCLSFTIKAKIFNTGSVDIGVDGGHGFPLGPGDTVSYDVSSPSAAWFKGQAEGDGIDYTWIFA
jgi:hypothetical protein